MKRVFFVVILALCLCSSVFAQDKAKETQVQTPTAEQAQTKTIFDYKDDLKLTEKQITDLKKTISDLQGYIDEKRKQLDTAGQELIGLIKDKADLKLIKSKLEQVSKIQVDISFTDIESSRKVESILTKEQLDKWKKIQEDYREKMQSEKK